MKKIFKMFRSSPKKKRNMESIYPPKMLVDIMEKSIENKRTSLEEMQQSQVLFHADMIIPKVLYKSQSEVIFAQIDGLPVIENLSLRHQKNKNLLVDQSPQSLHNDIAIINEQTLEITNNRETIPENNGIPVITFSPCLQNNDLMNTEYDDEPWISPGTKIHINGHTITAGLFYYGAMEGYINHSDEVSFNSSPQDRVQGVIPYTYSQLSNTQRGDYLSWLSGDRDLSNQQMWCIELYVYDLELKMLTEYTNDKQNQEMVILIYKELTRINSIRSLEITFKERLSNLLWLVLNLKKNKPQQLSAYREKPIDFENIIWANKMAKPLVFLDSTNLLKWYEFNSKIKGYKKIRNHSNTGKLILDAIYEKMFNSKLQIPHEITDVIFLNYNPINPNLATKSLQSNIIDFTHSSSLFVKISSLIQKFNSEIENIIEEEKDEEVIELLLINSFKGNDLSKLPFDIKLRSLLKEITKNNRPTKVDILSLIKVINSKPLKKANLGKTLPILSSILYGYNYQLIPDFNSNSEDLSLKNTVIYKHNNEYISLDSDSILELKNVTRIAFYNLQNHQNLDLSICVFSMTKYLNTLAKGVVSIDYQLYVEGLVLWASQTTISKKFYHSLVESLNQESKLKAAELIYSSCLKASKFDDNDHSRVKVFFALCDFSTKEINKKIRKIELEVNPNAFALDHKSINKIQTDTDLVQKELTDIFSEADSVPIVSTEVKNDDKNLYPGLNANLTSIFNQIRTKSKWNVSAFNMICKAHDVLPNGAIESINDWAFDTINTTLIEDDLSINKELLDELLGELDD